jgi:NADPH:quinone reductase-like Zn-dependent oxidoreductase
MDAVRFHTTGGPEVLELEAIDRPAPGHHGLVVEIEAAAVNPVDAKVLRRSGLSLPKTSGSDLAGSVAAVGEGVTDFEVGDRVFATGLHSGRFTGGSFAEFAAVPVDLAAPLPDGVSFETGAAAALVGVTAWRALVDHAGLEPGASAFVHGGNGGVGHVAVSLASAMGADVVCSAKPTYAEALSDLGADAVVDYDRDDLVEAVGESLGPADAVVDHRPQDYLGTDVELARFGGDVVVYGGPEGHVPDASGARSKEVGIQFMSMSNLATHRELPPMAGVLERLGPMLADGRLEVLIDREYGLADTPEALRAVLEESVLGKILVVP